MLMQMFSKQLLNMFYLLKDVKNRFFNENKKFFNQGYKSVNSVFVAVVLALFVDFAFLILFS